MSQNPDGVAFVRKLSGTARSMALCQCKFSVHVDPGQLARHIELRLNIALRFHLHSLQIYLYDCSTVSPYPLLFFGGDIAVKRVSYLLLFNPFFPPLLCITGKFHDIKISRIDLQTDYRKLVNIKMHPHTIFCVFTSRLKQFSCYRTQTHKHAHSGLIISPRALMR